MEHFWVKKEIKIEPEEIVEFPQLESYRSPTPFEIIPFEPAQDISSSVPAWLIPVDFRGTKVKKETIEENVPPRKPVEAAAANVSRPIDNAVKVSSRDPRLKGAPAPLAPRIPAFEKIIKVNQPFPISSHTASALPANKIQKIKTKDAQTQTSTNTGTLYLELSDVELRLLTKSQKETLIKFKKEFEIPDDSATNSMVERIEHRKANRAFYKTKEGRNSLPAAKRPRLSGLSPEEWW